MANLESTVRSSSKETTPSWFGSKTSSPVKPSSCISHFAARLVFPDARQRPGAKRGAPMGGPLHVFVHCPIVPLSRRTSRTNVSIEWRSEPTWIAHNNFRTRPLAGVA